MLRKEYAMATLNFVQSDTLPQIKLTLTNEVTTPATPVDLSTKIVQLNVKPSGTGVSFYKTAVWPNPTTAAQEKLNGICYIVWLPGELNRPAGSYTAEVELYDTSANTRETVYDTITINIREDIGDIVQVGPPQVPAVPTPGDNPPADAIPGN